MRPVILLVSAHRVGDIETGRWCDHCAKPAGVRFTLAIEINGRPNCLQDYEACFDGCSPARKVV